MEENEENEENLKYLNKKITRNKKYIYIYIYGYMKKQKDITVHFCF